MAPRQAPAQQIAPGAFPAARQYATTVAPVDATTWSELGPYAYHPDDRRYIDPAFSNSGSGSDTGRITGIAVAPDGTLFAGGGVWMSTDAAHQQWTPLFDHMDTMAIGTVAVIPNATGRDQIASPGKLQSSGLPPGRGDRRRRLRLRAVRGTWARVGNGLPDVITTDLSVTPDGRLLAATHGRGLWAIPPDGLS